MKEINLNYAATSAKKPQCSIDAMIDYLRANNFSSPARGGEASLREGRIELNTRLSLAKLFNVKKPEQIIFTPNVTTALNMIIYGAAGKGGHVITTHFEHNAVARPLEQLRTEEIIDVSYIPCDNGRFSESFEIDTLFTANTKLMVMTHASNVTGEVLPYEKYAKAAKAHGVLFVLDAAQTAGLLNIDFDNSDIDILAFTGHKALMGPAGTGGFIIKENAASKLKPYLTGGTGSISHLLTQPDFLPDKFEPGTPNILGILGLGTAVDYILDIGVDNIFGHEYNLTRLFMEGITHDRVNIYGPPSKEIRMPVVSFNIDGVDNGELSEILYEKYGISARSGLHCAPLMHKALGTFPEGALRISFGYFTTEEEVEYAIKSIKSIL